MTTRSFAPNLGIVAVLAIWMVLVALDNRYALGQKHQLQDDMQGCLVWREGRP